jgi:putative peptidoglycan lipid II flippase
VTLWVSQNRGGTGTLNVYVYVQAIYLLPYAVLAVPFAMSALPALANRLEWDEGVVPAVVPAVAPAVVAAGGGVPRVGASEAGYASVSSAQSTLAASARAILVATTAGAAVLVAVAAPVGAFFSALDAGRHSPAGRQALAALPDALSAFAPGLVGFGLAALFTRALYVQGRPAVAGALVALGWLIAAVVPLMTLQGVAGPHLTLLSLGLASSLGMTVTAFGLFLAVRRAWGAATFRGLGRGAAVAVGAAALSALAGRYLADRVHANGLVTGAATAVLVALVVMILCAALIWVADRESARLALARLPARRRGRTQ